MKYLRLLLIILLTGCSGKVVEFEPSNPKLPDAKVGEFYFQTIYIGYNFGDEPAFLSRRNTYVEISPDNTGLTVIPSGKNKNWNYNKLIIRGVPDKTGSVTVSISGFLYRTMYDKSNSFEKEYLIKIK